MGTFKIFIQKNAIDFSWFMFNQHLLPCPSHQTPKHALPSYGGWSLYSNIQKGQGIFPLNGTNMAIQGHQHKGVCPVVVAFLRWKSAVLLKWENEGSGSLEAPLPTAGSGTHGVKFRPRWVVLWKSFVRNQYLVRKGTVLRLRMVKTTTSHSPFKGQTSPPRGV